MFWLWIVLALLGGVMAGVFLMCLLSLASEEEILRDFSGGIPDRQIDEERARTLLTRKMIRSMLER